MLTLHAVHNDFHATRGIFPIFDGLQVEDMEKPLHTANIDVPTTNDRHEQNGVNGVNGTHKANGMNGETKEANGEEKQNPSLLAAAKAAALEVTNGVKGLAVSN